MAPKKMAGMPLEDESDNESAFYEAENRNVALTTASFGVELRRRQVKEFKVFPEKDEKNHVKQWRKWCRDALAELQKLKAYGGGSLANFAAQKLHLEKEKQASRTAWEQSDEWADEDEEEGGADAISFSSAQESTIYRYKDLNEAVKELDRELVPWVQQCLPTWAKEVVALCGLKSAVKMMVYTDKEVNPDLYTRKVSVLMDMMECEFQGDYTRSGSLRSRMPMQHSARLRLPPGIWRPTRLEIPSEKCKGQTSKPL